MTATSSLFIGLLSMVAFWAGMILYDNMVVAILFLVLAVLIGKTLQPVVIMAWEAFRNKFFPLPPVTIFRSERFPESGLIDNVPARTLGMRVLAMTEELNGKKHRKEYMAMVAESLEALDAEFPLFRVRRAAVERRQSPVEYVWSVCGADGENMKKCFSAWMRTDNCFEMKARQQNRDLFLHDGTIDLKDGNTIRYTVMVLFDCTLPVTIPRQEEPSQDSSPN